MLKKQNSMIIKGIAILMMLWHHCFLSGRFEMYEVNFFPFKSYQISNVANFFKICVSLFAFVSGYGLMESYHKKGISLSKWIRKHLVHTLSHYWIVITFAWIICTIIDQRPIRIYDFSSSLAYGFFNMGIDFLGLGNLFGSKLLDDTWWYMSASIVFIFMLPILDLLTKYFGWLYSLCLLLILPRTLGGGYRGGCAASSFLFIFYIGMIFSQNNLFLTWENFWKSKCTQKICAHIFKFLGMMLAMGISYKLYYYLPADKFWEVKWGLIPLIIILFIYDYVVHVPIVKNILLFLGKHSANIFLVHAFILYYYCGEFIYSVKHFILIISLLLTCSIIISLVLEAAKKQLHYNKRLYKLFQVE